MTRSLLWIHGWGMSPHSWTHYADLLPEFEHSFVSFTESNSTEDFFQAIEACLHSKSGNWSIIGWSMGGMLAMEMAFNELRRKNHHIENIIIVGGTLRFIDRDRTKGWPRKIVERMRTQLLAENSLSDHPLSKQPLLKQLLSKQPLSKQPLSKQPETLRQFVQLMFTEEEKAQSEVRRWIDLHETDFTSAGLDAGLIYLLETDLTELWEQQWASNPSELNSTCHLKESKLPSLGTATRILWIHGEKDAVCPIGCVPKTAIAAIISGAGHVPFITERASFLENIRGFLHANTD